MLNTTLYVLGTNRFPILRNYDICTEEKKRGIFCTQHIAITTLATESCCERFAEEQHSTTPESCSKGFFAILVLQRLIVCFKLRYNLKQATFSSYKEAYEQQKNPQSSCLQRIEVCQSACLLPQHQFYTWPPNQSYRSSFSSLCCARTHKSIRVTSRMHLWLLHFQGS